MKTKFDRNLSSVPIAYSGGMTILDVLLAIAIFVIGMLALASLQGNLTRSAIDANSRTVGSNLAEEIIEQFRTYERLETSAGADAYQDIASQTMSIDRGGVSYTVAVTVEDWYFMPDNETLTKNTGDLPSGQDTTISNFKNVELAVSWTGGEFQVGDGTETTGRLGSGNFVVSGIISSVPSMGSAKIAAEEDALGTPEVPYTPGEAPDIVALKVGDQRFKESTTPEPVVRRRDELVETWFDVITYNAVMDPNIFLRREEFVSISCECEIKSDVSPEDGRKPTLWTGAVYAEGDYIQKTWGESATNQQSQYCDVCCRDHHDASGSATKYRPWMKNNDYSTEFNGDHPHYNRDNRGQPVEAVKNGDTYLEACRLIRKDGFFRAAQDFNLSEINEFPENYMSIGDTENYSNYVRAIANEELGDYDPDTSTVTRPANETLVFDGYKDVDGSRAAVPPVNYVAVSTQLRSRGIYLDTMNLALKANLDNCFGTGDLNDCEAPDATSPYELYPFYDVQVTHLARWSETTANDPVHISNDEINPHGYSRGKAQLAGSKVGTSKGTSIIETGNVGLISTLPVTPVPEPVEFSGVLYLVAGEGTEPPIGTNPIISGTFDNEGGTSDAAAAKLTGSEGVECSAPTNGTFQCILSPGYVAPPTLTITEYHNKNSDLYVCSNNGVLVQLGPTLLESVDGANSTTFQLPIGNMDGASITITKRPCT